MRSDRQARPVRDPGQKQVGLAALRRGDGPAKRPPRAITKVSIEIRPAYVAGAKNNPGDQPLIVFDKSHVIAHVNQAVDETRKAERRPVDQADGVTLEASKWVHGPLR